MAIRNYLDHRNVGAHNTDKCGIRVRKPKCVRKPTKNIRYLKKNIIILTSSNRIKREK